MIESTTNELDPPTERPKTRVAVVGCGYWGPNLIRNFNALPNARVAAVCDLQDDRLEHMRGLYPGVKTYTDYGKMLAVEDLDAVVIATPVHTHHPLAKEALLAGKHTLIEKPMASSVAECEELNAIADRENLTLMVGHTFLYSEPIHRITEIISHGDIGEVRYINSQRLNLGLFQQDINVTWDLAPHDLSIILHVMGEMPDCVNCQGNAHVTAGIEDVTNISLNFGDKRFASVQSSWLEPRKVRLMTFVGSRRTIVFDDLEPREKIRIYDVHVDRPPHYDSFAQFHYSYHYGDLYIPHLDQQEPLRVLCDHFLDCIAKGNRPLSCGRKGLELVRILEACSQSLQGRGAPVDLPNGTHADNGTLRRRVERAMVGP
ncbi:MAG: Gfo/Idh/MocA family oxidoreductase [Akkermansiaceae bacterium]|nr:Gfo/Idh/MocA family oxidoreductase [Akkermansiaceae bacterium]NNM29742.1 Gfo/Idh/MocA family oxidoreductase [Akkermansiaceae bacterium]